MNLFITKANLCLMSIYLDSNTPSEIIIPVYNSLNGNSRHLKEGFKLLCTHLKHLVPHSSPVKVKISSDKRNCFRFTPEKIVDAWIFKEDTPRGEGVTGSEKTFIKINGYNFTLHHYPDKI